MSSDNPDKPDPLENSYSSMHQNSDQAAFTESNMTQNSPPSDVLEEIGEGILMSFLTKCPSLVSILDSTSSLPRCNSDTCQSDRGNGRLVAGEKREIVPGKFTSNTSLPTTLSSVHLWVNPVHESCLIPDFNRDPEDSESSGSHSSLPAAIAHTKPFQSHDQSFDQSKPKDNDDAETYQSQSSIDSDFNQKAFPSVSNVSLHSQNKCQDFLSTSRFSITKVSEPGCASPLLSHRSATSLDSDLSKHVTFGMTERIETDTYPSEHDDQIETPDVSCESSVQSNSSQQGLLARFARMFTSTGNDSDDSVQSNSSQQGPLARIAVRLKTGEESPNDDTLSSNSSQQGLMAWFARKMSQSSYGNDESIQSTSSQAGLLARAARNIGLKNREKLPDAKRYMKNLIVLGIGFMFTYLSFFTLRNLQSSLNAKGSLGLISLCVLYGSFVCGCFLATAIVQRLKPKWTIVLTMCGTVIYSAANFYPTNYTLIPASILAGFCISVMWCAQGTYVASIASSYSAVTKKPIHNVMNKFYGIFFMIWQLCNIFGNLISSVVLSLGESQIEENLQPTASNTTEILMNAYTTTTYYQYTIANSSKLAFDELLNISSQSGLVKMCGARYCHSYQLGDSKSEVSQEKLFLLYSIFLLASVLGLLTVLLFLNKLKKVFQQRPTSAKVQLLAVFKVVLTEPKMQFLLPVYLYLGIRYCFIFGEVTKGIITCAYGVKIIGYVLICYATCAAFSAVVCGRLAKCVPRPYLLALAFAIDISVTVFLLIWYPNEDHAIALYLAMFLYGVPDGVFAIQFSSMIGLLFSSTKEAAFSTSKLMSALALAIGFSYAPYFCMATKTYILLVLLFMAMVSYTCLEVYLRKKNGHSSVEFEGKQLTSKTSLENVEPDIV